MQSMIVTAATLATLASLAGPATRTHAQETGSFSLTQNGRAIATETFTRTDQRLETRLDIATRGILEAVATLEPDATVQRLEVRVFAPGATGTDDPVQTSAAVFTSDQVRLEQPIGSDVGEPLGIASDAVPYLNPSPSYMEQILRRARAIGGNQVEVPIWAPGATASAPPATVTFDGDRATLMLGSVEIRIDTDPQGRLLGATVPSQNLTIERD